MHEKSVNKNEIIMQLNLLKIYDLMLRSRLFEEAIAKLWHDGLISGEMHLGTGEEAIVAGIVDHLHEGDAMALDHRGTAALLMRGLDPLLLLRELLGHPAGLCGGMGGHMHLFSREHLAVSSGIVGAGGPAAVGFGLAAQYAGEGNISVGFFGEGAMNQGMLMESLNLAVVWDLPVVFICKDDDWSIVTKSANMTGGELSDRARAFGLPVTDIDGWNVSEVWEASRTAIERARSGQGPSFLHARCVHLEGHFLGLQLLRAVRKPLKEMPDIAIPLTRSFLKPRGGSLKERMVGMKEVLTTVLSAIRDPRQDSSRDPIRRTRKTLLSDPIVLKQLEDKIEQEMSDLLASGLKEDSL